MIRIPRNPIMRSEQFSRRSFLAASALAVAGCSKGARTQNAAEPAPLAKPPLRIIDLHQHTNYSGRTDEQLIAHQKNMGVALTILLPAGHPMQRDSTHGGKSNGLAATTGPNEHCYRLAQEHPDLFRFFANEVSDAPEAREEIEKYLKLGALGIGEQKFNIDVQSPAFDMIVGLARDYGVPVLIHFQVGMYNHGYPRFWAVLEKYPDVNFIAHAQTTWANVDAANVDNPKSLYPKGPVQAGGLTDRYLRTYPNFFADMSAGSGLNAMNRDPERARAFLARHQDKLIFGSDCNDKVGKAPPCQGALTIAAIKHLALSPAIARKIFHDNATRLFRLA